MNDAHVRTGRLPNTSFVWLIPGFFGLLFVLYVCTGSTIAVAQSDSTSAVYTIVDTPPEVNRGENAASNALTYPDSARAAGIEGTVFVQIVVERDGHPTDVKVVRGVDESLDEEARRFVRGMTFTPGREEGEIVRTQMTLPIRFEINQEEPSTADSVEREDKPEVAQGPFERPPKMVGGLLALQRLVDYPKQAIENEIEGRVFIRCIVSKEGIPTNVHVKRSVHPLLDRESIRVVRQVRFEPAIKDGEPVAVQMTLPVTFRLK